MRLILSHIILCGIFILGSNSGVAQNIRVFFYAPSAAIQTNFSGATAGYINIDSCSGSPTGFSYVLVDGTTAARFRIMAPPLIRATYDSLTSVTSLMRRRIMGLSSLSNGLVNNIEIYMYDDRTGIPAADNCMPCDEIFGTIRGVWPCADNERISGAYLGYVYLGELGARHIIANAAGGYWAWNETIVHEFSHTQFANEYNAAGTPVRNKWGANGISISYGGDAGHWGNEIMADQQMALDEGLATFWGLEANRVGKDSLITWLNKKSHRFVLGSHSFLTGTPAMWNSPHDVLFTGTIPANRKIGLSPNDTIQLVSPDIQTGANYELRHYKWLDVPGQFVLYNEQMFQAFALLFNDFAFERKDTAFNKILSAAKVMTPPNQRLRYPALMANHLANSMERYASTTRGRAEETAGNLTSSMFAYALYDIITHFSMTETDFKRELSVSMATYVPVPKPKAFDQYWTHRAAVKAVVCPHLGGNNCQSGPGNIDIIAAVTSARTYFRDPSRILR